MIQLMGHADAVLFWFAVAILLYAMQVHAEKQTLLKVYHKAHSEVIVKSNDWKHLLTKLLVKFGVANVERPY